MLNPVSILAYVSDGEAAPQALSPRCHDDDTDLRQVSHLVKDSHEALGDRASQEFVVCAHRS